MLPGLLLGVLLVGQEPTRPAADPATLTAAIGQLGSFDFHTRVAASRLVRRAGADVAAPLLEHAVRDRTESYLRFRAFVLLTGTGDDARAAALAADMLRDRDDRVRMVACQWIERHPDTALIPALVAMLPGESSPFVRPALTRALAAMHDDPRAREALLPLVMRGDDVFRAAVIEAVGRYRIADALSSVVAVARLDGPLQDEAISAIGRIGDPASRTVLAELQASGPAELQPTISAALCLLGVDCEARVAYVRQALTFASITDGYRPLLHDAVHALTLLAAAGRDEALVALFDAGLAARDQNRDAIALGIGIIALRNPALALRVLDARPALDGPATLLLDAFDLLTEDADEERFYVALRAAYWAAAAGSTSRRVAEEMMQRLEF